MSNYNIEHAWRYQKAVYWASNGYDEYGQPKVDIPVELDVRWEDIYEEALDARGNSITLDAMVVVDREVPIGSIFWKGTLVAYNLLASPSGYKQAMYYGDIPDIRGQYTRQTVKLMRFSDELPDLAS